MLCPSRTSRKENFTCLVKGACVDRGDSPRHPDGLRALPRGLSGGSPLITGRSYNNNNVFISCRPRLLCAAVTEAGGGVGRELHLDQGK